MPQRAAGATPVEFDGERFTLHQGLLRRGRRRPSSTLGALRTPAACVFAASAYAFAPRTAALTAAGVGAAALAMVLGLAAHNALFRERAHVLSALYLPSVMKGLDKAMRELREELLKGLRGKVLDVGCATGLYLRYARGKDVSEYVALEPNTHMHAALKERAAGLGFAVRTTSQLIQDIPASEDATYDAIILGNVLCEVPEQDDALRHCRRLLKDGARCYFSEHVLDDDSLLRRWLQHALAPWWERVSDGCHCNRRTLPRIVAAFGAENVFSRTVFAGTFPWTARFELGLKVKR